MALGGNGNRNVLCRCVQSLRAKSMRMLTEAKVEALRLKEEMNKALSVL